MTPTHRLALTDDERADLAAAALDARIRKERAEAARPHLTRLERVRAVLESP